jgi:hypothetical protein
MDTDLDTLATALYVTADDLLKAHPERVPERPRVGFAPRISDAEIITLSVMQALLGFVSETRWVRFAANRLKGMFPHLPGQSGYNKRLRKLAASGTLQWINAAIAARVSIAEDTVWVADSTPVECARSRETVKRSRLAGWAQYGYCASHTRYFWGLRLHLVATLHGLPVAWAITGAKADEREVLATLLKDRNTSGHTLLADKGYYGRLFEAGLEETGIHLIRPARKGEPSRPDARFLKPLRQTVESVFDTLKGQLDLERHGGRTTAGVIARITQRILALTAAIWHNDRTGAPILRSLTAYDH